MARTRMTAITAANIFLFFGSNIPISITSFYIVQTQLYRFCVRIIGQWIPVFIIEKNCCPIRENFYMSCL